MRAIFAFIGGLFVNALIGAVLTAVFTLGNFTAYWIGVVSKPTWGNVLACFIGVTSLFVLMSAIETAKTMYHYKTDAGFRHAMDYHLVGTWKEYKKVIRDIDEKEGKE